MYTACNDLAAIGLFACLCDGAHPHARCRFSHAPPVFYYAAPAGQSIVNSIFFGVQETKGIAANFLVKTLYVDQFHSDSPIVPSSTLPPVALGEGSISFLVTPAQSALNTDPSKLVYTVYYSPDTTGSVILYTECGVTQPTVQSLPPFTINSTAAYKVTLTGLDDTLYKFNVFVSDPAATTGPTAYSVQTAQPSSGPTPGPGGDGGGGGSGVSKVLLGVLIPVGVIVLALLAYLFIKNRRLSQELEVEMGDVPSAALRKAARGAPDVSKVERAQRHHKLLGEEEDDSSSDTYVAPSSMAGRRLQDL
jgi:hypothetical protein